MKYLKSKITSRDLTAHKLLIVIVLFLLIFSSSCRSTLHGIQVKGLILEFTFRDFFVDEPLIYTTRGSSTLYVLNNSNFEELEIIGEQTSSEIYRGFLLKHNNYLVLFRSEDYFGQTPDHLYFLEFIDVSDITNPILTSEVQLPTYYDVAGPQDFHSRGVITIDNNPYLFIHAIFNDHFLCINISNIFQPELLVYNSFPGEVGNYYDYFKRFFIKDNIMFIPTKNATQYGFVAYNFTTLQSLTKVSEWFGETNLTSFDSIYASQNYLQLKKDEAFIEVFNIQNLTEPDREGYINLGSSIYTVFRGNYLINFQGSFLYPNLTIVDYSNITDLKITGFYLHPRDALGFYNFNVFIDSMFTDSLIYIPIQMTQYNDKMLYVLDWSDPYNLFVKATLGFPFQNTNGFPIISSSFLFVTMICIIIFVKMKPKKKVK